MLFLNSGSKWVEWKEAGVRLQLVALSTGDKQRIADETTELIRDDKGRVIDFRRDAAGYQIKVGQACIRGWDGVVDDQRAAIACTPDAIAALMSIPLAASFVILQVEGLSLLVSQELTDAGKDFAGPSPGAATAVPKH